MNHQLIVSPMQPDTSLRRKLLPRRWRSVGIAGGMAALVFLCSRAVGWGAAVPDGITVSPVAIERGVAQTLRVEGAKGAGPFQLWTSFAGTVQQDPDEAGRVQFKVEVPAGAPLGVAAVRLMSSNFVSALRLVFVDELPVRAIESPGHSVSNATPIQPPLGIPGRTRAQKSDIFRFAAVSNQMISLDLLGRRLASRFDPILRVMTEEGVALRYNDYDRSFGADSRIAFKAPRDGNYLVEVRDLRNGGGAEYGYYLRVGGFPMMDCLFPLAVGRGTQPALVALGGLPREELPVPRVRMPNHGDRTRLEIRRPGTPGFSEVPLRLSDLPVVTDTETNHPYLQAQPLPIPSAINGRFNHRGDVDWFRFEAAKGEKLTFRAFSRSLGSAGDVVLRLVKTNSQKIVELDLNKSLEPAMDHTFDEAGPYLLRVWEATGQAEAEFVYRVEVERFTPRIRVHADSDHFVAVPDKPMKIKVTAERTGYEGPIHVALAESVPGVRLETGEIPAGKKEGEVSLALTDASLTGLPFHFSLKAESGTNTPSIRAPVLTHTAPNFKWLRERRMPAHLDGLMTGLFGVAPESGEK